MGFDQDLNKAWAQAKAQTIKFLSEQRNVPADQAAKLMTTVSDCRVSQVVNIKKGIHCLNPKNPSAREDMERPTKETAKYYVSHAKDADLNKAMDDASMGMIKWLESEKKIARLDAYGLASVAMDCRVGAISDTEKNVHCLMPEEHLRCQAVTAWNAGQIGAARTNVRAVRPVHSFGSPRTCHSRRRLRSHRPSAWSPRPATWRASRER